jgi:hypothetical protein
MTECFFEKDTWKWSTFELDKTSDHCFNQIIIYKVCTKELLDILTEKERTFLWNTSPN